ncbi:MAG: RHS repeat-associated core domain-containing protein [Acidobacteria bacterium]|nr:RHS repeat-associated core domain-containing protein [Acidobacteriota bacterium]
MSDSKVYDPFGEVAAVTGVSQVTVGFQGDYTDPTTSEVWMGARWYDPTGAQFRTRDTVFGELMTPVSLNRYTYGFANPLLFWDPDGKFAQLGPLIEGAFRSADAFRAQVKADQKIKTPAQRKALVRRRRRISGEGFDVTVFTTPEWASDDSGFVRHVREQPVVRLIGPGDD